MKRKKIATSITALTLSVCMLTGCEGISQSMGVNNKKTVETANLNETINHESKWINSEIEGAIDENTQLNIKDDFYSAVNRDWLLNNHADAKNILYMKNNSNDITSLRLLGIIEGEEDAEADGDAPVPEDELAHDEELVNEFSTALMDWDSRNATGYDTLKKYTDYIEALDSADDVSEYFLGNNGENLKQLNLVSVFLSMSSMDAENYYVYIYPEPNKSLNDSAYKNGTVAESSLNTMNEECRYLLENLGYTDKEIDTLFKKCFKFESKLVDHFGPISYYSKDWFNTEASITTTSMDEIKAMEGNFPLSEILEAYGYDNGRLVVTNPKYVKYIGKLINDKNLDEIKAYLIVNTVKNTQFYLDEETYDHFMEIQEKNKTYSKDEVADDIMSDMERYYLEFVQGNLQGALDTIYISKYCKQAEKEDLSELTATYMDNFHEIFSEEDWISDETKAYANEKLEAITCNILYPDEFLSHDYLDFGDDTDLLDMYADIKREKRGYDAELTTQKADSSRWDLDIDSFNTTTCNCFYASLKNSINIFAGYIADPEMYSIDMPTEAKLAKVGTVIGHEITHGFDANGAKYDKRGFLRDWWSEEDKVKFEAKDKAITQFYTGINPYPGGSYLTANVSGEVAADLGGLKCSLRIAKEIEDFDYEAFFRYFADGYAEKATLTGAKVYDTDVHPISYIRVNVDVMQFDEFDEAFGIEKGDGMYLAPDDRILIW